MRWEQALEDLFNNWDKQDSEFIKKWKMYKSRHLNKSGRQTKKVSKDKLSEMLLEAGYTENWTKPKYL